MIYESLNFFFFVCDSILGDRDESNRRSSIATTHPERRDQTTAASSARASQARPLRRSERVRVHRRAGDQRGRVRANVVYRAGRSAHVRIGHRLGEGARHISMDHRQGFERDRVRRRTDHVRHASRSLARHQVRHRDLSHVVYATLQVCLFVWILSITIPLS